MPCYVEPTGFSGASGSRREDAGAATLYSRGRGPTVNPRVTARMMDERGRIEVPLDGETNHITQYDPNSTYRVSWDAGIDGDSRVHSTNQAVRPGRPGRHDWPAGFAE